MEPILGAILARLLGDNGPTTGSDPTEQLELLSTVVNNLNESCGSSGGPLVDNLITDRMTSADVLNLVDRLLGERSTDAFKKSMDNIGVMLGVVGQLRMHTEPMSGFWDALFSALNNPALAQVVRLKARDGSPRLPQRRPTRVLPARAGQQPQQQPSKPLAEAAVVRRASVGSLFARPSSVGTCTAFMLVGESHPNHGGILPSHRLVLSENSRPAWTLSSFDGEKPTVWIPTVEDMLEDGLLMVGLLVAQDPALMVAATAFRSDFRTRTELYDDIDETERRNLHALCRKVGPPTTLVVCSLRGSIIAGQLDALADYHFHLEVCPTVYARSYSRWTNEVAVSGSLPAKPLP